MIYNFVIQSFVLLLDVYYKLLFVLLCGICIVQIDDYVLCIENVSLVQCFDIDVYCGMYVFDFGFVEVGCMFGDFGFVVMDMDLMLIMIECIDEIVDFCGLKMQVVEIIEVLMCGEICDFNESFMCCVVLLVGFDVYVFECVYEEWL